MYVSCFVCTRGKTWLLATPSQKKSQRPAESSLEGNKERLQINKQKKTKHHTLKNHQIKRLSSTFVFSALQLLFQ